MTPTRSLTSVLALRSRTSVALLCAALLVPGGSLSYAQSARPPADSNEATPRIPADQLDSLVAPIALYPDPLLAQVLVASTYPLEIIQLQQWLEKNKNLKGKALVDAVEKQSWDPSIQAMAALPDVVKRLAEDIQWTTDLGNAFLAQQGDVMEAVQRMRRKAEEKGTLKSGQQQKVETKVVDNQSVIVIEQANPQVVYVPSYDPVVAYGPPAYPYPPIYYPPAGYYAAGMALSFGVGIAMGAAWGGGWGWGCGWGGGNNDVTINNNNNFNRNSNINRGNINNGKWQHNPQHRGGAPYGDRGTANRYGGNARGDSLSNRQASARQQVGRQGGNLPSSSGRGSAGTRGGPSGRDMGAGAGRGATGADRVGSRDMSRGYGGGGRSDGFSGGSRGYNGSSARASGSRGASSMGSRGGGGSYGGGGGGRGGGGGGGGGRGGGGGGRGGGGGGRGGGGGGGRRR